MTSGRLVRGRCSDQCSDQSGVLPVTGMALTDRQSDRQTGREGGKSLLAQEGVVVREKCVVSAGGTSGLLLEPGLDALQGRVQSTVTAQYRWVAHI